MHTSGWSFLFVRFLFSPGKLYFDNHVCAGSVVTSKHICKAFFSQQNQKTVVFHCSAWLKDVLRLFNPLGKSTSIPTFSKSASLARFPRVFTSSTSSKSTFFKLDPEEKHLKTTDTRFKITMTDKPMNASWNATCSCLHQGFCSLNISLAVMIFYYSK